LIIEIEDSVFYILYPICLNRYATDCEPANASIADCRLLGTNSVHQAKCMCLAPKCGGSGNLQSKYLIFFK